MSAFLGIDTSNYTTSAALFYTNGTVIQSKAPLKVSNGEVGLRQSDAVFAHVKQLGHVIEKLMAQNGKTVCATGKPIGATIEATGTKEKVMCTKDEVICTKGEVIGATGETIISAKEEAIEAVGVAISPRDEAGSYMPCFLSGKMAAQSVAAALKIPLFEFSHQAGHIAAALYDTKLTELFEREFLAFHVSGGTTQCLLVQPSDERKPFKIATVSESLDLHAGQLVDRVGAMLGIEFPAGVKFEELAKESCRNYPVKVAVKGLDCCLSGVENQCRKLFEQGENPCDIANFCLDSITYAIIEMTARAVEIYPGRKIVYAGGVMSNAMIRKSVMERFDAAFASPAFSADNAAGIAVLCEKAFSKS